MESSASSISRPSSLVNPFPSAAGPPLINTSSSRSASALQQVSTEYQHLFPSSTIPSFVVPSADPNALKV